MAVEGQQFTKSFTAGAASLATKQFYMVKQHTDGTVIVPTAITDPCVGVLQNTPAVGEAALICYSGMTKLNSNAALSIGDIVGTATDGQAQAVAATNKAYGLITKASGAAGELAEALVDFATQAIVA